MNPIDTNQPPRPELRERLLSLDVLRGLDMLLISGLGGLLAALGTALWGEGNWLSVQMGHVRWEGLRFFDTLFPFFLFLSGATFPFSYANQIRRGRTGTQIHLKLILRAATLFLLGLSLGGLFSGDPHFRIPSVLGRIGLAWMLAALAYIHIPSATKKVLLAAAVLAGYYLLIRLVPAPDRFTFSAIPEEVGVFTRCGNIIGWLDRTLMPNHIWSCTRHFDPESLFSTLPAAVTALLGMFAGDLLRDGSRPPERRALALVGGGILLLAAGWAFAQIMPVNKSLWSSSFVLLTGGGSYLLLAAVWYLVDVRQVRGWTMPLQVIGVNSIAVYLSTFLFGFEKAANFFCSGLVRACGPEWGTVVWHAGYLAVLWLVFRFLYRHNAIIKI